MTAVWIVIPAYNEALNICEMVRRCAPYGCVLVVDDGSTDSTGKAALMAGARVLVNPQGAQHGDGIRTGLRYALNRGAEAIVTIDAGLSYRPEDIPTLLAALAAGDCHLVVGSRVVADAWRQQPWPRRLLTTAATRFLGWLTDGPPLDYSSLRAYTPAAAAASLEIAPTLDPRCHVFNPALIFALWHAGLHIRQVPVGYTATNSTLNLEATVWALWGLLCLWQARKWKKRLEG